ncbi:transcription factor SRM1-like isoform X2 [Primulina tabacum]|uniref:transcription factor SRM1-like isoform X2 n=1 Tax=Primulina tabacum TaxID=48773 RepID=UPI003F597299
MANTKGCGFDVEVSAWIWEEDKKFEMGLVNYPEGCPNRWEKVAAKVGTKSAAEVESHYVVLLDDVAAIEAGSIEEPAYADKDQPKCPSPEKKQIGVQRKAARPWTEDEHRLFLHGLEKYGKGDWKSISRYVVLTRNPTQVASHAQKYFERQEKEDQTKKRKSIFDDSNADSSVLISKNFAVLPFKYRQCPESPLRFHRSSLLRNSSFGLEADYSLSDS